MLNKKKKKMQNKNCTGKLLQYSKNQIKDKKDKKKMKKKKANASSSASNISKTTLVVKFKLYENRKAGCFTRFTGSRV